MHNSYKKKMITICSNKKEILLDIDSILYVQMNRNYAFIHVSKELTYQTRMTFTELKEKLGEDFIQIKRGCLVSAMAIHSITDKVILCDGEALDYAVRKRKEIVAQVQERQENIIGSFSNGAISNMEPAYHEHYRVFDSLPIAFTDIELVFDKKHHVTDWIFRYGNEAFAKLEKLSLQELIGNSFGSIFPDMDDKWLQSYERAALYGETVKIIDYSPEIDTYLDIIAFPTFKGHCGCILFDISEIKSFRETTNKEKALAMFIDKLLNSKG